jgi:hypothetical protein
LLDVWHVFDGSSRLGIRERLDYLGFRVLNADFVAGLWLFDLLKLGEPDAFLLLEQVLGWLIVL